MIRGVKNTVVLFVFLLPTIILAAEPSHAVDTPEKVIGLIQRVTDWAYSILLVLAVLFIVYAAYLYLFSEGDTEKTEKAKKQIFYAVVAVAIAILAKGIIAFVQNVLTGNDSSGSQPSKFLDSPIPPDKDFPFRG